MPSLQVLFKVYVLFLRRLRLCNPKEESGAYKLAENKEPMTVGGEGGMGSPLLRFNEPH